MDEELRERLRDAARSHHPDRARMLARIGRGLADGPPARAPRMPRRAMPWLRVAGASVAVCGVLVAGAVAVTSAGHGDGPGERVAAPPHSPAPALPSAPASKGPPRGALPAANGPLWTDGSVDPNSNAYWAQSNVTVKTGEALTALTVELRVALTGGVGTTGSWRSLPVADFTASAREEGGFLVYRWTLKPGRTAPAGTHTFAGQYNHAEGERDAAGDDYTVRGGTSKPPEGPFAAGGGFTPLR